MNNIETIVTIDSRPMIKIGKDVTIFLNNKGNANIKSKADFEAAGEIRNQIRSYLKQVEEVRIDIKKPVLEAGKMIEANAKKITDPLEKVLAVINAGMMEWSRAEEKKIKEINDRKIREAEEKAEKERLELEEKAKKELAAGNVKKAEEIQAKAQEVTVAPTNLRTSTKVPGFAVRKTWKGEVIDFAALPDEYKIVNQSKINEFARASAGKSPVAGVRFFEDEGTTGSIR